MKISNQEQLLYKAIKQINKVLIVRNLFLSVTFSTLLVLFIDFYYDLRFFIFLIGILVLSYISYHVIFKYKFLKLKKRLDPNSNLEQTINEGFINLKLGEYRMRLELKECHYYITNDFVFVFKAHKLMAIFPVDKVKQINNPEVFFTQFQKRKKVSFLTVTALVLIAISFIWKISLVEINRSFFLKDSIYKVLLIKEGDSVLFQDNNSYLVKLTNNQINENINNFTTEDVDIYIRLEPLGKIRVMYSILNNVSDKNIDFISKRIQGLYSYRIENKKIIIFNNGDNIKIVGNIVPNK